MLCAGRGKQRHTVKEIKSKSWWCGTPQFVLSLSSLLWLSSCCHFNRQPSHLKTKRNALPYLLAPESDKERKLGTLVLAPSWLFPEMVYVSHFFPETLREHTTIFGAGYRIWGSPKKRQGFEKGKWYKNRHAKQNYLRIF